MRRAIEKVGRDTVNAIIELGYAVMLFFESCYLLGLGHRVAQPVRMRAIFHEAMAIGVQAIPIIALLSFAIGIMLAIQGIENLKPFGAESKVVIGIALSVTREFAPLIVSILVAGRSGSAITARIGTMQESQEVDALVVIGINPVRYLVAPVMVAMLIMLPALTILGDVMGLLGGAVYSLAEMQISLWAYADRSLEILEWDDISQGLIKSVVFAVIITLVGTSNGFKVRGGAEAVGRATTRSVVMSISLIIIADMLFTYFLNR